MTTQPPITPTPELVQEWVDLLPQGSMKAFTAAAHWGADQELKACEGPTNEEIIKTVRKAGIEDVLITDCLRIAAVVLARWGNQ